MQGMCNFLVEIYSISKPISSIYFNMFLSARNNRQMQLTPEPANDERAAVCANSSTVSAYL